MEKYFKIKHILLTISDIQDERLSYFIKRFLFDELDNSSAQILWDEWNNKIEKSEIDYYIKYKQDKEEEDIIIYSNDIHSQNYFVINFGNIVTELDNKFVNEYNLNSVFNLEILQILSSFIIHSKKNEYEIFNILKIIVSLDIYNNIRIWNSKYGLWIKTNQDLLTLFREMINKFYEVLKDEMRYFILFLTKETIQYMDDLLEQQNNLMIKLINKDFINEYFIRNYVNNNDMTKCMYVTKDYLSLTNGLKLNLYNNRILLKKKEDMFIYEIRDCDIKYENLYEYRGIPKVISMCFDSCIYSELQYLCGSLLFGNNNSCCYIFYGKTFSGKQIIMKSLMNLLKCYCIIAPSSLLYKKNTDIIENGLELYIRRIVFIKLYKKRMINQDKIFYLINKYPNCKFILLMNYIHKFKLKNHPQKIITIPFKNNFISTSNMLIKTEDRYIFDLNINDDDFLYWILQGGRMYSNSNTPIDKLFPYFFSQTELLFSPMTFSVNEFINTDVINTESKIDFNQLYDKYKKWCSVYNFTPVNYKICINKIKERFKYKKV